MSKEKPKEKKEPTATQLFANYMRAVEKVRGLAMTLAEETLKVDGLSTELADRFSIFVTGQKAGDDPPRVAARRTTDPVPEGASADDDAGSEGYKPPTQHHAEALQLSGKGSQEVADIRREAGLDVEAGDSEELAHQGVDMMTQLQAGMKGTPAVVAVYGGHVERGESQEGSNAEGGPVRQEPVKE